MMLRQRFITRDIYQSCSSLRREGVAVEGCSLSRSTCNKQVLISESTLAHQFTVIDHVIAILMDFIGVGMNDGALWVIMNWIIRIIQYKDLYTVVI